MGREGKSWNRSIEGRAGDLHDLYQGRSVPEEEHRIGAEGQPRRLLEDICVTVFTQCLSK